jgi:hypothetical protein
MKKFVAPSKFKKLARKSLTERMKYPPSNRPMTSTGINRAKQIINEKPFSKKDLIKTRSYLIRAKTYYNPKKKDSQGRFTKGTIAYWSWGGDHTNDMLRWVEDSLEELGYFE